jgi:hypothetical protein
MLIKVSDLIRESWTLYKNNFQLFMKIIVWLLIPTAIMSLLSAIKISPVAVIPINLLFFLVSLFLGLFISIAITITIDALLKKEKVDLKTIYNLSYSKILSYLWVSILAGLAMILGTFLLIIPGLIFAVWFSFSAYVLVLENVKGAAALKASKNLVKDRFWPVLWRWFAPYAVYLILTTFAIVISIYLIGFALGVPATGFDEVTPWWSSLISNVVYLVLWPIFVNIGVILYQSLKKEKGSIVR